LVEASRLAKRAAKERQIMEGEGAKREDEE
jgi:hypothetical protein